MTATKRAPLESDDDCHVVPLYDLREHEGCRSCWCKPTEDPEYPHFIVHHAADGREAFQEGRRKPS